MRSTSLWLGFLLSCISGLAAMATTTGNGVSRLINVNDGFVQAGNAPGSNSNQGQWETDERFQGFSNAVNWFLTWDDNNLYVGRIGGNNAEGSLIYLKADKAGLPFSNSVQGYDGFSPTFSALNGINFVCYLKNGYDEFRTFNGTTWSAPNNSLSPNFSTQADGNHFEISIPWNLITNGNGKPDNLRAVFYQVVPTPFFVYGESPWGSGNGNDGPNVGVNDGAPTSAAQPGGNVAVNVAITRWWGCYPVIGGVGANGFVAVPPNAGSDIEVCSTQTSVGLSGNDPAGDAVGTWILVNWPLGIPQPVLANANIRNTNLSGLTANGIYRLVWSINYGRCPATPDTVVIRRYQAPIQSSAGPDQILACGTATTPISANDPGPQINFSGGLGTWSVVSGSGVIASPASPNTTVSGLSPGTTRLVWTISNGPCTPSRDTVLITVFAQPTADAGPDQIVCGVSTTLAGNNPASIQATANGIWTQLSGPSAATLSNPTIYNTQLIGLVSGVYQLKWKVSNGNCPADSSTVSITVATPVSANAGINQSLCGLNQTSLLANAPLAPAVGLWSQVSGPNTAAIANPANSNTGVTGLQAGVYVFKWKVSTSGCPADSANVSISIFANPAVQILNGQTVVCGSQASLSGPNPAALQNTASGLWTQVSGPSAASIQNAAAFNSAVTNLLPGVYEFAFTVSNGSCASASSTYKVTVGTGGIILVDRVVKPEGRKSDGSISVQPSAAALLPVEFSINGEPFGVGSNFSNLSSGTYLIRMRDAGGCESDTTFTLKMGFFIPNGISPNGDGSNEVWEIPGIEEYPNATVKVYNQWGGLVFESTGYSVPWDGTHQGKALPTGTYQYEVDLKQGEPFTGKISLER
jgi:gliding motility-associated-like protein